MHRRYCSKAVRRPLWSGGWTVVSAVRCLIPYVWFWLRISSLSLTLIGLDAALKTSVEVNCSISSNFARRRITCGFSRRSASESQPRCLEGLDQREKENLPLTIYPIGMELSQELSQDMKARHEPPHLDVCYALPEHMCRQISRLPNILTNQTTSLEFFKGLRMDLAVLGSIRVALMRL